MKIFPIYLIFCANFVIAIVAYYKKCYREFSLCLITNTTDESEFKLIQYEADMWCKEHSALLAIITNATVQSAIQAFINDSSAKLDSDVITNGYRYKERIWRWTNGISDIRHNLTANYSYAYLEVSPDRNRSLSSGQATSKKKFICSYQLKHSFRCPVGHQQLGRSCYKMHDEEVTWFDARSICLREEGSDLATFENRNLSLTSEGLRTEQYWIGLHKENWVWLNNQKHYADLKYSNWEDGEPGTTGGGCLCLKIRAGNWTDCGCSKKHRYVCIQDYASGSASTAKASTTRTTTTTTKITTTTTTRKSTQSTTTTIPTVGDSSSQLHSTPTHALDDDSRSKVSKHTPDTPDSWKTSGMLTVLGIGSTFLLILIVVIVVVVFIKNRRSSRSGDVGPRNGNSPPTTMHNDDAPNTVYAVVIPNATEPVRSPSEKISNQTVYAELDLEPKRNITQRASEPIRTHSEKISNQAVYAEVNLAPKGNRGTTHGAVPESEYANSLLVDSVYANSAQTKV